MSMPIYIYVLIDPLDELIKYGSLSSALIFCELPGCDNEPVCGNCMMCEDQHCHCFDEEK